MSALILDASTLTFESVLAAYKELLKDRPGMALDTGGDTFALLDAGHLCCCTNPSPDEGFDPEYFGDHDSSAWDDVKNCWSGEEGPEETLRYVLNPRFVPLAGGRASQVSGDVCASVPAPLGLAKPERSGVEAAALDLLAALEKVNQGCDSPLWAGFENGHGEECGKAIDVAVSALKQALSSQAEEKKPIRWPKSRDIARLEDMSQSGHLRITLDNDNDVCVEVFDCRREQFSSVEFCMPGGGGGKSSYTRRALIEVMHAMERDNMEHSDRAHPRFPEVVRPTTNDEKVQ